MSQEPCRVGLDESQVEGHSETEMIAQFYCKLEFNQLGQLNASSKSKEVVRSYQIEALSDAGKWRLVDLNK